MLSHYKLRNTRNYINAKRLNRCLVMNVQMKKKIVLLSSQNKELTASKNSLLLQKLNLENENRSIKNLNIQLSAMHRAVSKKLNTLEQSVQSCVSALVTMSQCIPSMLENVHEMRKYDKLSEYNLKEKKERQTKFVRPMVKGMTITQPAVALNRLDMSTIIELSSPEQTSEEQPRQSYRISPHGTLNLEPYVRLKDVKVLLKNSKTVPNENSYRQPDENLGEGPSWLHSQENQNQNSGNNDSVVENLEMPSSVINETHTTVTSTPNEIQHDLTVSASSSTNILSNALNKTETNHTEIMSPGGSNVLTNVRHGHSSSSIASDMNNSRSSTRAKRSSTSNVNYKETKLNNKFKRK